MLFRSIAPLSATQLTTPGVDHQWSIKDILVHLAFWQRHLLTYLQSAIEGKEPEKMTHETIDAVRRQYPDADAALAESEQQPAPTDDYSDMNDYIYLRNKSRQLDDVQTDFHSCRLRKPPSFMRGRNEPSFWGVMGRRVWETLWVSSPLLTILLKSVILQS